MSGKYHEEAMLLTQLIEKCGVLYEAPSVTRLHGVWYECIIGIGNDHSARITIDADSLAELHKLCNIPPDYGIPSEIADMVTLDEWKHIRGIE